MVSTVFSASIPLRDCLKDATKKLHQEMESLPISRSIVEGAITVQRANTHSLDFTM